MIKKENQKQLKRKVLIAFTSALLAFQNVVHSLTFIGSEIDLDIIAHTVQQIGSSFKPDTKKQGLMGYFKINNAKNIPVYFHTNAPGMLLDDVCVLSDSVYDNVISTLKKNAVGNDKVFCKLSEIDAQLENIKRLLNKTPVQSNVLPSNQTPQKPKTSDITPIFSIGIVATIITMATWEFLNNETETNLSTI